MIISNSVQLFLKAVIPAGIGGEGSISSSALPPSMEVAEIQKPGMARSLPSMALDTRFPAGMTHFFASVANRVL
ncbi:hypothetical protein [Methyloglobulus sp.]|uniref:hypothetical protein n=1 Tax=Methyloglobulus sp. TaxID=2518622 RepID=UPI0039897700